MKLFLPGIIQASNGNISRKALLTFTKLINPASHKVCYEQLAPRQMSGLTALAENLSEALCPSASVRLNNF